MKKIRFNKGLLGTTHKLSLCNRFPSLPSYIVLPVGRPQSPDVLQRKNMNIPQTPDNSSDIDNLFRSRVFWIVLLAITYVLPAVIVWVPTALAFPWIMIPGVHLGLQNLCGLQYLYGAPAIAFAIVFHLIFWTLCVLLLFRARKLSVGWLRSLSILFIVILVLTIIGCCPAIDAVRH